MTSNSRYSMFDSMDTRCARCGYENNPQFRFCGMCGAPLRPPDPEHPEVETDEAAANTEANSISRRLMELRTTPVEPMPAEPLIAELTAAQQYQPDPEARTYSSESRDESYPQEPFHGQRTPIAVTGPSFLGLSDSGDDRRVEYLLEDEPHPGRARKIVGTLLVLAVAATLIFYWRRAGYPWPSHLTTATDTSAQSANPTPSVVTPPMENGQIADKPKAGVGDNPLTPVTSNSGVGMPNEASTPPRETEETTADAKTPGSETPEAKEAPEKTENAESPALPAVPKIVPTRTAALSKPRPLKPSPAMAAAQNPAKESLFLEGQKYLYGSGGVSSNCARAQQYLTASANNNNPKAQSTLGTMYATGHCAQRDLPVAYRWFARALREDPRNTRLSKDVEIMWNQMTAQERTLALKNE
jgi:hypothetical protein